MKLTIGYLYGDLMNIYGDTGNIIALTKRAKWRGIEVKAKMISIGTKLKKGDVDIYFFGGGQDQNQQDVSADIQNKAEVIKADVEKGVPLLSICGGYQLLGDYYAPFDAPKLPGISLFPAYTEASHDRMIGNIVVELTGELVNQLIRKETSQLINRSTDQLLIGFENHSGKTYLKPGATPLGTVVKGFGNNGADKTEGCIYKNAIGCYMHGSLLPKNPHIADWLLKKALEIKYGKGIELEPLNDDLETSAHQSALQKFS